MKTTVSTIRFQIEYTDTFAGEANYSTVKVTCGWHELEGKAVGDRVTVTKYRTARVGSGMDRDEELTGVLVGMANQPTRCYGCSFAWREAEIRVD